MNTENIVLINNIYNQSILLFALFYLFLIIAFRYILKYVKTKIYIKHKYKKYCNCITTIIKLTVIIIACQCSCKIKPVK